MKKILFAVSAVALALSAGSAMAADLPSRKEAPVYVPPPPPPPMWTGFYAGLNIGGGWGDNNGSSGYSAYYDPRYAFGATPTGSLAAWRQPRRPSPSAPPTCSSCPTAIRSAAPAASSAALRSATTSSSVSS